MKAIVECAVHATDGNTYRSQTCGFKASWLLWPPWVLPSPSLG